MATYDLTQTIPSAKSLQPGDILNCPYSGRAISIDLPMGVFTLQCWGAQGGNFSPYVGGKGGYSVGTVSNITKNTFILYSGGQNNNRVAGLCAGGFNGGGAGWSGASSKTGSGGGGASDIRIGTDSLYARVIVAGGGGGSYSNISIGGCGGGVSGGNSSKSGTGYWFAYGGSQTSGGANVSDAEKYFNGTLNGTFGNGGNITGTTSAGTTANGGGGGWYGGAIGDGGGGGSGYIYTADTAPNYPSGCLLNASYYLSNAQTIDGANSFPSTSGGTETGHEGTGYVRITVISVIAQSELYLNIDGTYYECNGQWVKINGVWRSILDIKANILGEWK